MKGPGLRIDLDVRRVWRCAKCGRTTRTAGQVTAQRCGCGDDSQWMRLEPPVKREPWRAPPREPLPEEEAPVEPSATPPETAPVAAAAEVIVVSETAAPVTEPAVAAETAAPQVEPSQPSAAVSGSESASAAPGPAAAPADEFGAGLGDNSSGT